MGLRDYAMFLLIATYGLRASEIVALKLDDIHWRIQQIRIPPQKSSVSLQLPLTDPVASSLIAYLRCGRPQQPYRELFLRCRAPAGVLKPTAVTEAFQVWTKRSGLNIPYQGPHCLSYVLSLLCSEFLFLFLPQESLKNRELFPFSSHSFCLSFLFL
jgi:integrase